MAKQFSTQAEQPLALEFGKDTVYERSNFEQVETEDNGTMWSYEETQYTYPEYVQLQKQNNDDIMLALTELADIIGG